MFVLEIRRERREPETLRFEDARVFAGRSPETQILIPSPRVARRHILIEEADGVLRVEDLRSTNGTFLRGRRLAVGSGHELRPGDVVGVPDATLTVVAFEPLIAEDFDQIEADFLAMLARDHQDDVAREVYADALEERRETLRAAYLRAELARARGATDYGEVTALERRLAAAPRWLARVARHEPP